MSKPKRKPWKKHKQALVSLSCGVRCEVDKNLVSLIQYLNYKNIETRHSCEGRKYHKGYVSMFGTPTALGMAHYLLEHGSEVRIIIERDIHPYGYENLTLRWPKKNQKNLETLIHNYFS